MKYKIYNSPTGYSDTDYNQIDKTTYIQLYILPQMPPTVRRAFAMMKDGYILHYDGRTGKYTLRRGDEIIAIRSNVADAVSMELIEECGQSTERGLPDRNGRRRIWKSVSWRLNHEAKSAADADN